MKILFLPAYFYPEQAASSYLGTNRFEAYEREGFDMVVYAPMPTRGISEELRKEYLKRKKEHMYGNRMIVHRFGLFKEGRNPVLRAIRYMLQLLKQFNRAVFSEDAKDADIVFLSSTPPIQGILGSLVKKCCHKVFIYCLQDIFPDSLIGTGLAKKGGLLWRIGRAIEDFTYRNADKIIVISEDFRKNIMAKGVPEEKIVVIYNWVDEQAVVDVPRENNVLFDRYKLDRSKFYVSYNGNIGLTQNMEMLMAVAKELEAIEDIHFVLVGNGAYKERLVEIIRERNVSNVTLLPFQPYEDISHVFSLGDVSLVVSKPGVGANSVPSKTWSIMSASRPILASFDENELKSIITDNNCGIFTKSGDEESFKDAIIRLYNDRELCREMGRNGRKFIEKNLTREIGTRKYIEVLKSVVR